MYDAVAIPEGPTDLVEAVETAGFPLDPHAWIVLARTRPVGASCIWVAWGTDDDLRHALEAGADHLVRWPGGDLSTTLRLATRGARRLAEATIYRDAFRRNPLWQEITDDEVRFLDVSEGFELHTGIPRDQAIGRTPGELFRGGTHDPSYYEHMEATLHAEGSWRGDLLSQRLDGSIAVVDAALTDSRRYGACLAQYSVKLEVGTQHPGTLAAWISEQTSSAWLLVREDGIIVEASHHGVLGRTREELLMTSFGALDVPLALPNPNQTWQVDVWRERTAWQVTAFGRSVGAIGLTLVRFDDVTLHKTRTEALDALARQLADARDEAQAANRAKSAFLAAMSHDLRTPLNAILGYGELLAEEVDGLDGHPDLEHILTAGRRLLQLVDEVLDLARVESGAVIAEPTTFPVRPLLEDVAGTLAVAATRKGQTLAIRCPEADVRTDRAAVHRILCNLVSNAVKYAVPGPVVLGWTAEDGFFVEDAGPGLTDAERKAVFAPFHRLQQGGTGVGLGLALCRRLAGVLGGTLDVERTAAGGSRFRLTGVTDQSGSSGSSASSAAS